MGHTAKKSSGLTAAQEARLGAKFGIRHPAAAGTSILLGGAAGMASEGQVGGGVRGFVL